MPMHIFVYTFLVENNFHNFIRRIFVIFAIFKPSAPFPWAKLSWLVSNVMTVFRDVHIYANFLLDNIQHKCIWYVW